MAEDPIKYRSNCPVPYRGTSIDPGILLAAAVIKQHAKEVRECGLDRDRSLAPSEELAAASASQELKPKLTTAYNSDLLPVVLLVEFVECLEKAMFNASDGCAVVPHPSNKARGARLPGACC